MRELEESVKKKNITALYHFTKTANLPSIMAIGILPRSKLEARDIAFEFSDAERRDDAKESTSVSISFPNYKMFYVKREENSNVGWVVLDIKTEILWRLSCAFCEYNAAATSVRRQDMNNRMTLRAFENMFADTPDEKRNIYNLPTYYTTEVQAEVLVFDEIPASMIRSICVKSQLDTEKIMIETGLSNVNVRPDLFAQRKSPENQWT